MSTDVVPPVACTTVVDEASGLRAFVVVDTLVEGRAMGGVRIAPGVTLDEVKALARKMTLKLLLAGLPIGGAKGGIVSDLPYGDARDRRLRAFGQSVSPLIRGGVYLGSDLGCTYRDRDLFFDAAGYQVRNVERRGNRAGNQLPCSWSELWEHCADATGFGVAEAGQSVIESLGLPETSRTAVIQGFGVVGRGAARRLSHYGHRIVGVADAEGLVYDPAGLPVEALCAVTDATGRIDRSRLPAGARTAAGLDAYLDLEAGVLVLAAKADAITLSNHDRVKARVVVEGANLPVSTEAQAALFKRDVAVVPDIVANCGGAATTAFVLSGLNPSGASTSELVAWIFAELTRRIGHNIREVQERAARDRRSLPETADRMAHERAAARLGVSVERV